MSESERSTATECKWQREYRAFQQLLPGLLKTHQGRYVAIHEGRLVDSDEDQVVLVLRVYATYGYVPIHVGLVVEKQPVFRIPSHRTLPRPVISSDWKG